MSKRKLALKMRQVSPYCASTGINSLVKVLNKAVNDERTERPLDFRYRLSLNLIFYQIVFHQNKELENMQSKIPSLIVKLSTELKTRYRISVDVARSPLSQDEYYLLSVSVMIERYIPRKHQITTWNNE